MAKDELKKTGRKFRVLKNFGPWRPTTESGQPAVFSEAVFASTFALKKDAGGNYPAGIDPETYHAALLERAMIVGAIVDVTGDASMLETPVPLGPEGTAANATGNSQILASAEEFRAARKMHEETPGAPMIPAAGSKAAIQTSV